MNEREKAVKYCGAIVEDVYVVFFKVLGELESAPVSEDNLPKVGYVDITSRILLNGPLEEDERRNINREIESVIDRYEKLCGYKRVEKLPITKTEIADLSCKIDEKD